jgi:alkylation response protein AidB-like acyl-CoA dehydrogenase
MPEIDSSRTNGANVGSFDPIEIARRLQPIIRTHADETERGRRLAGPVVDALHSSGLFTMGLSAAMGGSETPIMQAIRAIEEISYADGYGQIRHCFD